MVFRKRMLLLELMFCLRFWCRAESSLTVTGLLLALSQELDRHTLHVSILKHYGGADHFHLVPCSKHFGLILNYLRDGTCVLPQDAQQLKEILQEAEFYVVSSLR